MDFPSLALALGSSLTAGLNLYITVLALGLMHRWEFLRLPEQLEVLAHPWVLLTAAVLLVVEFFADKVPYVDNLWDAVHTFIRVPAGALLAVGAMGNVPAHLLWTAALLGGFVSFTAHGAKATTRLAVNSTPEPFTNWFLSFLEDALSLGILYLVSTHPLLALLLVLLLVGAGLTMIILFYHVFRRLFQRQRLPTTS